MMHPPRPSEGRFSRRREAGRGAAPAGLVATRHPGGIGAPSGATRSPCQELADGSVGAFDARRTGRKQGPMPENAAAIGAPRGARVPQGTSHKDFALFGAPSPSHSGRVTRRGKEPACAQAPDKLRRWGRGLEIESWARARYQTCYDLDLGPQRRHAAGKRPCAGEAAPGAAHLACRDRGSHRRHDPGRRRHAAHRFGPVHHRVAADHGRRSAAQRGRLDARFRGLSEDSGIYRDQARHEPGRVQDHLLVGMGASLSRPADRRRLLRALRRLLARGLHSAHRCCRGLPACSCSADYRARSAGTW